MITDFKTGNPATEAALRQEFDEISRRIIDNSVSKFSRIGSLQICWGNGNTTFPAAFNEVPIAVGTGITGVTSTTITATGDWVTIGIGGT